MYHLSLKQAEVLEIKDKSIHKEIIVVQLKDGKKAKAINYPQISGSVNQGDQILLNTTACQLGLGTGGFHFVVASQNKNLRSAVAPKGHIMKLRYTPLQMQVLAVEERASAYHDKIKNFKQLYGLPVVIIPLHSLLAPLAITFKKCYPEKKLIYMMTEGGSLSLKLSNLVDYLCRNNYIDLTITVGQAFGGDLEAVNVFSALAAGSEAAQADLIVVGMGPGLAGTATKLGFSGMENILIDYAVKKLQGTSFLIPRISLAETRKRHYILSHHTETVLEYMLPQTTVIVPQEKLIKNYIQTRKNIFNKHHILYQTTEQVKKILVDSEFDFNSMGRRLKDDPLFFLTGGLPVICDKLKSRLKYRE